MKTISVPKDVAAMERLDRGMEEDGDLIEVALDGAAFDRLFASGWVQSVNEAVGCNIDDFEDEHVTSPSALDAVLAVTDRMGPTAAEPPFPKIASLVEEAKRRGTGLHFHF
jgi:hypothetical protein